MPSERWHCLLSFQQKNTRRLKMFFQLMAHFQAFFFSLRVELETFSALSFQSSVLHSSGFSIRVRVLYPEQVL